MDEDLVHLTRQVREAVHRNYPNDDLATDKDVADVEEWGHANTGVPLPPVQP